MNHTGSKFMKNIYSRYGKEEFAELCCYLNKVCRERNIEAFQFPDETAAIFHQKIKEALSAVLWGDLFPEIGCEILIVDEGPAASKCLKDLDHDGGSPRLLKMELAESDTKFLLEPRFEHTHETPFTVKLQEDLL